MDKTKLYFVTYKYLPNVGKIDKSTYDLPEILLSRKSEIISTRYETDSKGKLHVHHLAKFKYEPYVKVLAIKNYSLKIVPVYDIYGVMSYMNKQCRNIIENEQLTDSIYFRTNYAF